MRILWANAARATLIAGLGAAFMLIGKLFIIAGTVVICYWIYDNAEAYEEMSTPIWCLIIIFVISMTIA